MDNALRAEAFAALYLRTRQGLVRWCRKKAGDWEAEEVVNDAMLIAWEHWRTGESIQHPDAWLRGIVWYVLAHHVRDARRRTQQRDAVFRWYTTHDRLLQQDTRHLEIREALLRIPSPERESLIGYAMGDTGTELAQRFGTGRTTQVMRVKQARDRLAHCIAAVVGNVNTTE